MWRTVFVVSAVLATALVCRAECDTFLYDCSNACMFTPFINASRSTGDEPQLVRRVGTAPAHITPVYYVCVAGGCTIALHGDASWVYTYTRGVYQITGETSDGRIVDVTAGSSQHVCVDSIVVGVWVNYELNFVFVCVVSFIVGLLCVLSSYVG